MNQNQHSNSNDNDPSDEPTAASLNFIEQIVAGDNESGKHEGRVHTRFPPEPNGYLHIGHAKSICLNFGIATANGGKTNLRFDDTNPAKEETEYVDSIMEDVRWLGFQWDNVYFASDYFQQLYDFAEQLIKSGHAYVCSLDAEKTRSYRGGWNEAGKDSPYRSRDPEENLDLFRRMKAGEFTEGEHTLRAKIDMASPNMNMRDPTIYRIRKIKHHRTGSDWCIYPMYDYAHGISDSIERITHSICTLEFEHHRPLYNWFLETLDIFPSRQIEFARLNITHTMMSKRKLLELVQDNQVSGWDDPRMPTICGLRRRGYTPESIRNFCTRIGVTKQNSRHDMAWLEDALRADLNKRANRRAGVLRPLKVVIENYPEDQVEQLDAINNPEDESAGKRKVPFGRELYIERTDFMEDPPKKFFRLGPGREVRLRYGYFITCTDVIKNDAGEVVELRCSYDPETLGGQAPDGRRVRGTIHWVAAATAITAEVRLYDHLFQTTDPFEASPATDTLAEASYLNNLNENSLEVLTNCKLEPSLKDAAVGELYQFERLGYFCVDNKDSSPGNLVFNRSVTLRDTWAKMQRKK
ncbi:MAG: glutamine--tRNA ligase/YqeY domain fusion protein [Planctomycetaceae bacterium]|jgi:glutaminyl-tRNA synthetase|nr:glutamine--tRNA ligase/YqeY domain fusion protein [Planctomycetaceae bacterium]MBT4723762.1 glutamine--tRNA ligase/YqeY domain fusion protein [Planctomycetaceae bacterium]MBT5126061.1 glutamine--tRNA ligase/YqeY domain fusion protein [Planctomycetaceae bacterium]MBT5597053.1 glutamine--tRNA ligase/YqeY domain fusion protein [Planctomycetaceae bacterium]MBT6846774.1 glutamine--tRNA ligase/YqeY domain fusion protein [Planctomycetaceae bacterium]